MIIRLSTLSTTLQAQIRREIECSAHTYTDGNIPIVSSKHLKAMLKDYLLTTNLTLTAEEEAGIKRGEYSGVFVRSNPGRRYEVILVKSSNLTRIKKALSNYIKAEQSRTEFDDAEEYSKHLSSLSTNIPLKGRVLCTRQGVSFLTNRNYKPLDTNLGRNN